MVYIVQIKNGIIESIFNSDDPVRKEVLGHRRADWSQQLKILVKDIQVWAYVVEYLFI